MAHMPLLHYTPSSTMNKNPLNKDVLTENAIGIGTPLRGNGVTIRGMKCGDSTVYDEAGNVIETLEHKGEFKEW